MLEQAVADGLITQAQADELTESGRVFPFGGRWNGWLVKTVWITIITLQMRLVFLWTNWNLRLEAFEAQLTQAVEDGRLTQEEADLMIARKVLHSARHSRQTCKARMKRLSTRQLPMAP